MRILVIVLLMIGSAAAQAYLPKSCEVGDVSDSYVGHWQMCATKDKWEPYRMDKTAKAPSGGIYFGTPYWPDCRLAFKDDDGNWHCPWESASGRVVACEPCHIDSPYPRNCERWYKECLDLVEIMHKHKTAEPTKIEVQRARADNTPYGIYECPDGFSLHWYNREKAGHSPICIGEVKP